MKTAIAEILELPIPERNQVVAEIWDSFAKNPENIEVSEKTLELLEKRLSEHRENPESGSPWKEVKSRILN